MTQIGDVEAVTRRVYRLCRFLGLAAGLFVCLNYSDAVGWDGSAVPRSDVHAAKPVMGTVQSVAFGPRANFVPEPCEVRPLSEYLVKLAYGTTFLTSTPLDYATLEVSAPFKRYSIQTPLGGGLPSSSLLCLARMSYTVKAMQIVRTT